MEQGILSKSWFKLSSGTRLELVEYHEESETYSARLRTNPSHKLCEQGFPRGIFEVPEDCVTLLRPREDVVPAVPRINRPKRQKARAVYIAGQIQKVRAGIGVPKDA